jgi:ABC-2 type transport system permease protein
MTALSTVSSHRRSSGVLPGLRPLVRKDVGEWAHGKRVWVVAIVVSLFMVLSAANAWIMRWVFENVPGAADGGPLPALSFAPMDAIATAVGSQIFVLAALFAAMSVLVSEREHGTLAWVASKPVSRSSIWLAKFISSTAALWVAAGIVPTVLTAALVTVLYGAPPIGTVVALTIGIGAVIALYVAITLAASAFVTSQPAVAGIGFAAFALPGMIAGLLPIDIAPYLPSSILGWVMGFVGGAPVGIATPIAFVVGMGALAIVATKRMESLEL